MSTADVVTRETAWLATFGDSLPALLVAHGGPWGVVQAYWPGNRLATQKPAIYVTRGNFTYDHVAAQRYRPQHVIHLKLIWPVRQAVTPIAEGEQQAFDNAIELLVERIAGPVGDKTHAGRFLSVGEVPGQVSVQVDFDDPEATVKAAKELRATAIYHIDDFESNG